MRLRWSLEEIIMKRVYAEMILKGMMSENSESIVNNILNWMETIDERNSDNFMDIITGVTNRCKSSLKVDDKMFLVNAAKDYMKNNYSSKSMISISITSELLYENEFSTTPSFKIFAVYNDNYNKKKISKEDYEKLEELKKQFAEKYNEKDIAGGFGEYESNRKELYNFVGNCKEYSGEGCVEVTRVDYNSYTVRL